MKSEKRKKSPRILKCEGCGRIAAVSPWPYGWFETYRSKLPDVKFAAWCSADCVNKVHPGTMSTRPY